MKKIAFGLVVLAGVASLAACKSSPQTYRPAPTPGKTTYSSPTYSGPSYTSPTPAPAPRAACGGGKCG